MNLEIDILNILIVTAILLLSYYPVNKAANKRFELLGAAYVLTVFFRLTFVLIACLKLAPAEVLTAICLMTIIEPIYILKVTPKVKGILV